MDRRRRHRRSVWAAAAAALLLSGCGLKVLLPDQPPAGEVAGMPLLPGNEEVVREWVRRHANPRDSSIDLDAPVPYVESVVSEGSPVPRVGFLFARTPWRVTAVLYWLKRDDAPPSLGASAGTLWGMPLFRTAKERERYAPDAHVLVQLVDERAPLPVAPRVVLPPDVLVKTPTRTFHREHLFAIDGGKLWFKRNPSREGWPGEPWRLFGTGGPTARTVDGEFHPASKLLRVTADGDDVLAVDEWGRVYLCTTESTSMTSQDGWEDAWGYPGKRPLYLKDRAEAPRALSIGRRAEHAMWFEDAIGNVHHFGPMGTTTLYALTGDGQHLLFTDNGLPNDFSRELCLPDDGRFAAENLSASASALFVIDRFGRMATRFDDYDLNGGTPNFEYTYRSEVRADDRGDGFFSSLAPYYLPLPPWRWHAPPPLAGQARLSSDVTVLQTGQGNAARELRVAGLDEAGRAGFWKKGIDDEAWAFVASDEVVVERLLEPQDVAAGVEDFQRAGGDFARSTLPRAPGQRSRLAGWLQVPAADGTLAALEGVRVTADWNVSCPPARLTFESDGVSFGVTLHTVDLWTPMKRQLPGADGTPQWLLGTLVFDDAVLTDRRPAVQRVVHRLRRWHHGLFALLVEVNGPRVEVTPMPDRGGDAHPFALVLKREDGGTDRAQWPGGALWAQALAAGPDVHAATRDELQRALEETAALRERLRVEVASALRGRRQQLQALEDFRGSIKLIALPVRLGRVPRLPALLSVQAARWRRAIDEVNDAWRAVDDDLLARIERYGDALTGSPAGATAP